MNNSQVQPNFQEIWNLFMQTEKILKKQSIEADKRFKETEKFLKKQSKETDKRFKEADKRFKEAEKFLKEQSKETDKKIKEMSKEIRELTQDIKRTEKMVGNLSNRWGEFVEGMVKPGMLRMFKEKGINIEQVFGRCSSHRNGGSMEIDILGVNGPYVVAVEVKSKLTMKAITSFIKRLGEFKRFFPAYSDKQVIGAVAGITIYGDADRFAVERGLFVIGQAGEAAAILNAPDFKPKFW